MPSHHKSRCFVAACVLFSLAALVRPVAAQPAHTRPPPGDFFLNYFVADNLGQPTNGFGVEPNKFRGKKSNDLTIAIRPVAKFKVSKERLS